MSTRSTADLLPWIYSRHPGLLAKLIPATTREVVVPFGGSGRLARAASRRFFPTLYTEAHPLLVHYVEGLRRSRHQDINAAADEIAEAPDFAARYQATYANPVDPIEAAAVVRLAAFNAQNCLLSRVKEIVHRPPRLVPTSASRLWHSIGVAREDFAATITSNDHANTCFLLDPPWPDTEFYEHNLDWARFTELLDLLAGVKGRFLLVVPSHRRLAQASYERAFRIHRRVTPNVNGSASDLVVSNFSIAAPQITLLAPGDYGLDYANEPSKRNAVGCVLRALGQLGFATRRRIRLHSELSDSMILATLCRAQSEQLVIKLNSQRYTLTAKGRAATPPPETSRQSKGALARWADECLQPEIGLCLSAALKSFNAWAPSNGLRRTTMRRFQAELKLAGLPQKAGRVFASEPPRHDMLPLCTGRNTSPAYDREIKAVRLWLNACVEQGSSFARSFQRDLFASYVAWAEANEQVVLKPHHFGTALTRLGHGLERAPGSGTVRVGLRLRPSPRSLDQHVGETAAVITTDPAPQAANVADSLSEWLSACCLVNVAETIKQKDLYESYRRWFKARGYRGPVAQANFGIALTQRGILGKRSMHGWVRHNITLRPQGSLESEVITVEPLDPPPTHAVVPGRMVASVDEIQPRVSPSVPENSVLSQLQRAVSDLHEIVSQRFREIEEMLARAGGPPT